MTQSSNVDKSVPRRHHYIAQSLLSQFSESESNKKRIWVFDKSVKNSIRHFKTSITNIACESDYHSLERKGQEKDHESIERVLSNVETHQIEWIRKIIKKGRIEKEDQANAAALFSTYRARVPQFKDHIRKYHQELVHVIGDKIIKSGEVPFPDYFSEELKQKIQSMGSRFFKIEISNRWLIGMMLKTAFSDKVIKKLGQLYFTLGIIEDDSDFLVLPDNPVSASVINAPRGIVIDIGPMSPFPEFCMPISKNACLIARWNPAPESIILTKDKVEEINRRSCIMATRFVFSPVESPRIRRIIDVGSREKVGLNLSVMPFLGGAYMIQQTIPIGSSFRIVP
jgi:Protein of unknown function (DUF4238)